ncbi:MAG: fasciclin domain-containing protein [Saprospiraceae bacterium]|nr:fasciclin domain-containing protein [Saprospiraceae bacterium]
MKYLFQLLVLTLGVSVWSACGSGAAESQDAAAPAAVGQSGVQDDVSQKNIVQIAVGSKDHTTLVAAVQAASLVDALSNAGPFTVFAPTDAAFAKVPKETLDNLMKPENKAALSNILEYHTFVGVVKKEQMRDGQKLNQVNLKNITLAVKDGVVIINGTARIVASVPASNGIVHIIDTVLLPE